MVAENFPARARAWSGAIFHASSVFGTFLAVAVGEFVVANPQLGWRWAFGIGVLPALLTLWIRWQLRDGPPKATKQPAGQPALQSAMSNDERGGTRSSDLADQSCTGEPAGRNGPASLRELFVGETLRHLVLGVSLATVGLATFWGVHIYGKDALRNARMRELQEQPVVDVQSATTVRMLKRTQMTGMFLTTIGGGAGLLAFGPLCAWLGRRPAFALFHLGGFALGLLLFGALHAAEFWTVACLLPVFGFLTLGMHAGYAIYFPELFPTRLRGAGAGFCFNVGRVLAAPVLFGSGWVQKEYGISLYQSAATLSVLFLVGLVVLWFAPETKGKELR
jgi:MFS family permease